MVNILHFLHSGFFQTWNPNIHFWSSRPQKYLPWILLFQTRGVSFMWQLLPSPPHPLNQCLFFSEYTLAPSSVSPSLLSLIQQEILGVSPGPLPGPHWAPASSSLHSQDPSWSSSVSAGKFSINVYPFFQRSLLSCTLKIQMSMSFKLLLVCLSCFYHCFLFYFVLSFVATFCFARDQNLDKRSWSLWETESLFPILHVLPVSKLYLTTLWSVTLKYLHYSGWSLLPRPIHDRLEYMTCSSIWLALIKGIWAEVTSSHFQAEASRDIAYSSCISYIPMICQE